MIRIAVLFVAIFAMALPPAYSANVTVIAEGLLSEHTDPDGLLPYPEPASGTIFSLEFTYDSSTPGDATSGYYGNPILNITLAIGDEVFDYFDSSSIVVIDDGNTTTNEKIDLWQNRVFIVAPTEQPDENLVTSFGLSLSTVLPTVPVPPLTSQELVPPPWPAAWDRELIFYEIRLETGDSSAQVAVSLANITSITIVPLPASMFMFASAVGLLGWSRRKA